MVVRVVLFMLQICVLVVGTMFLTVYSMLTSKNVREETRTDGCLASSVSLLQQRRPLPAPMQKSTSGSQGI